MWMFWPHHVVSCQIQTVPPAKSHAHSCYDTLLKSWGTCEGAFHFTLYFLSAWRMRWEAGEILRGGGGFQRTALWGLGNCVFRGNWASGLLPTPLSFSTETLKAELILCSLLRLVCPPPRMSSLWIGTLAQLLIRAAFSSQWPLLKEGWPLMRQNPNPAIQIVLGNYELAGC